MHLAGAMIADAPLVWFGSGWAITELASLEHQETRLRIANASADELRAILREHSGLE